jgi:EpsI family protein
VKKSNFYYTIACLSLLLASLHIKTLSKEVEVPLSQSLENIPVVFGHYASASVSRPLGNLHNSTADDWILRSYAKNDANIPIFVFVGYWERQDDSKKIGSPRYTQDGWGYYWIRTKTLITSSNRRVQLEEFLNERGEEKELVYYCYIINGRVVSDEYRFRFLKTVNSLFRGRNNAALLRVSVPVNTEFPVESAEKYIENFITVFLPLLKNYLP